MKLTREQKDIKNARRKELRKAKREGITLPKPKRSCDECGKEYEYKYESSKYCGNTCKGRGYRATPDGMSKQRAANNK
jgi:hypothetical protein